MDDIGTLYVLYDGSSCDGRGNPYYIGRTKDKKVAKAHFNKCKKNPYSIGEVRIMTDTTFHTAMSVEDLED